ncbi:hypothetical protein BH10BAC5_BH10BAC5_15310 [soil metagenome]
MDKNPSFIPPPSKASYDAYTTIDYLTYSISGKKEAELLSGFIDEFSNGNKIFDFGCGSARILRFMDPKKYDLTGSDYNNEAIKWSSVNFPLIKFIHNELMPPIDIRSSTFNFVFAISVFTHLSDEAQFQWLTELERITTDNGCILITLHGNRHSGKLTMEELKRFHTGRSVVRGHVKEGSRIFTSYHSEQYAREIFFKGKEIIHFTDNPLHPEFSQDVYILRVRKQNDCNDADLKSKIDI